MHQLGNTNLIAERQGWFTF